MTLRYASRDCIYEKRAHLGISPQLQTQGVFLESGVLLRVILTEKKRQLLKPFLLQTQLNLVTQRVIQDTAIYIRAMSCVPILNSGFCRTLLFKHKPNNFGRVNQTTIFYFWQGSINKTETNKNNKKLAITVIQAKVPMSNNSRKSVLRTIWGQKTLPNK